MRGQKADRESNAIRTLGAPEPPQRQGVGDALRTIYAPYPAELPEDLRRLLEQLD